MTPGKRYSSGNEAINIIINSPGRKCCWPKTSDDFTQQLQDVTKLHAMPCLTSTGIIQTPATYVLAEGMPSRRLLHCQQLVHQGMCQYLCKIMQSQYYT